MSATKNKKSGKSQKSQKSGKVQKLAQVFAPIILRDFSMDNPERNTGVHVYQQQGDVEYTQSEMDGRPYWRGWFLREEDARRWIDRYHANCRKQHTFLIMADDGEEPWPLTQNTLPPLGETPWLRACRPDAPLPTRPILAEREYNRYLMV